MLALQDSNVDVTPERFSGGTAERNAHAAPKTMQCGFWLWASMVAASDWYPGYTHSVCKSGEPRKSSAVKVINELSDTSLAKHAPPAENERQVLQRSGRYTSAVCSMKLFGGRSVVVGYDLPAYHVYTRYCFT